MKIKIIVISSMLSLFGAFAFAEEPVKKTKALPTAAGDGLTLPPKVMRARLVGSSTLGNTKSFDKDGEEVSTGMTLKATGGAFVLEYGVLKHLSLQLVQKYVE
ncbi:MAG: hypothetical protein CMP11_00005, partial [Zetaproteobacteria bacterium]|nr:hypothetical protein [Pseudobdellovibrionaceae bacterium]